MSTKSGTLDKATRATIAADLRAAATAATVGAWHLGPDQRGATTTDALANIRTARRRLTLAEQRLRLEAGR